MTLDQCAGALVLLSLTLACWLFWPDVRVALFYREAPRRAGDALEILEDLKSASRYAATAEENESASTSRSEDSESASTHRMEEQ